MSGYLRLAMLLLAFAELAAAATVVLVMDRRSRRVRDRVETLNGPAVTLTAPRAAVMLRPRGGNQPGGWARLLFAMPGETLANLPIPPRIVFALGAAIGTAAGLLSMAYASLWLVPVAALIAGLGSVRVLFGWQRRRYAKRLLQQMPDMIEMMVSAVRVGLPVGEALRSVAREMPSPTREEFAHLCNQIAVGVPTDAAMRALHQRTGLAEYGILAMTLGVQTRSGGRLAETIQNLAETIRQRLALASKAHALAAEAKLSAGALSVLPLIAAAGLSMLQPGYLSALLDEPEGRRMLGIGLTLLTTGILIMRWMIQRTTDP